jgi:multidrug efflux pump subunit AcrB
VLNIARDLNAQLADLRKTLPPDVKLSFYYDQSLLVKQSVDSVWEAIVVGLIFAVLVLYAFLRNWGGYSPPSSWCLCRFWRRCW